MPRHSALKTILLSALGGLVLGAALGFLMALLRGMPLVPTTLAMAAALGFVMPLVASQMIGDLRLARLGSLEEKRAVASKPVGRLAIASARAAVAIESGDLECAARALGRIPRMASKDASVTLVRARYALARGEPTALDVLLAWEPPKLRGRALVGETRRYHAYVLANAFVSLRGDERRDRAATRLLGSSDPEVRAYGAWLVAFDDDDASVDARSSTQDDLLLGAVFARHEGLIEVARTLEARAATLALRGRTGPYRG